jgi:hypothetical protein
MTNLIPWCVVIFLAASGCTTLSKTECESTNWEERGVRDAKEGKVSQVDVYRNECRTHKASMNSSAYTKGREAGLRLFCTFENGVEWGRAEGGKGREYLGICPPRAEPEFLKGMEFGKFQMKVEQSEGEGKADLHEEWERLRKNGKEQCSIDADCSVAVRCMAAVDRDGKSEGRCKIGQRACAQDADCTILRRCEFGRCKWE